MTSFSISRAATAGFAVAGRAPLAVLAWGLLILVTMVGPLAAAIWVLIPQFVEFYSAAPDPASGGAETADPAMMARMMRFQSSMMGVNLLTWVGGALVQAVVAAAVFRAVLQPDQKRWAYLRLGKPELWLALVTLVQGVLFMMAYFAVLMVSFILGMIVYLGVSAAGEEGKLVAGLFIGLVVVAAIGTLIWAVLRLSMAGPMTFVDGQFRLFESWAFTRGQGWRLLGMAVLLGLIVIALELAIYAVVGGGVLLGTVAYGAGEGLAEILDPLKGQPPSAWLRAFWPLIAGGAAMLSVLGAFVMTVVYAPWAKAYQELATSGAVEA